MAKRMSDIFFSIVGLMFLTPLLLIIAFLIKKEDGGPVFYRGVRVGLREESFRIFKFRTMVADAEIRGASSTSDDDTRITRIGRFLRKYKLDELPQLINVLKGEMSFVGPRPEVQKFTDLLSEEEKAILTIRPGITDWASIWNSDEGSVLAGAEDPDRAYFDLIRPTKIKLQLKYVRERSLITDLKIILLTLLAIVRPKSQAVREIRETSKSHIQTKIRVEYPTELLKKLYRTMVQIRLCEESLVEPILKGEIHTPCHLYSGQEAVAAGICASLKESDYVFGTHRSHGHYLAMGCSMPEMVAEIYCCETGSSHGRGGSMHLSAPNRGMVGSAPIVAGTISLAMGAALASSIRGEDRVAISFFGDGATGEGVLYECLNFAALKKLPMVFVCENNFYSTHMPIQECRVDKNIYRIGAPFCIESLQVNGNDILAVYEAGKKAIDQCRQGEGPVLIECLTYRFRGHVGPDDNIQGNHIDIRPKEEVESWLQKDPIKRFEEYLLSNKLIEEQTLRNIRSEVEVEVIEAHRFAKTSTFPNPAELPRDVFKERK
jgi:pyruvate dehydrogenase E1 component alpha subunit